MDNTNKIFTHDDLKESFKNGVKAGLGMSYTSSSEFRYPSKQNIDKHFDRWLQFLEKNKYKIWTKEKK